MKIRNPNGLLYKQVNGILTNGILDKNINGILYKQAQHADPCPLSVLWGCRSYSAILSSGPLLRKKDNLSGVGI